MDTTITIEQVEALAERLEADDAAARAKAERLVRAYARILAIREPELFVARPREERDEEGHWDNSYPPKAASYDASGPALYVVEEHEVEHVPTSGGFYFAWKRVTTTAGTYVAADGSIWGCDEHGTGRLGQYAAHPGDCDREIELEWSRRRDVATAELQAAELALRALAFPAASAALDAARDEA